MHEVTFYVKIQTVLPGSPLSVRGRESNKMSCLPHFDHLLKSLVRVIAHTERYRYLLKRNDDKSGTINSIELRMVKGYRRAYVICMIEDQVDWRYSGVSCCSQSSDDSSPLKIIDIIFLKGEVRLIYGARVSLADGLGARGIGRHESQSKILKAFGLTKRMI
eukprot:1202541-Amorphochlora_amoeboformis.AAC.2